MLNSVYVFPVRQPLTTLFPDPKTEALTYPEKLLSVMPPFPNTIVLLVLTTAPLPMAVELVTEAPASAA